PRPSGPRPTCPSGARRTPATATARPASRRWRSSASGSRSTSTTAATCSAPRSTPANRTPAMVVGTVREIKDNEYRVGLVPGGVKTLADSDQQVLVEARAGEGSGISDDEYRQAGAGVVGSAAEVWKRAEVLVKVKEPIEPEYAHMG